MNGRQTVIFRTKCLFLIVYIFAVLVGCTMVEEPKELVKRPAIAEEKKRIEQMVTKFLSPMDALSKTIRDENEDSIIAKDLDGDGKEEWMILYKKGNADNRYGIVVVKEMQGSWKEVYRTEDSGIGIDFVSFSHVTGDRMVETIIGWDKGSDYAKKLKGFTFKEGSVIQFIDLYYRDIAVDDLDGDGAAELIIMNKEVEKDGISLEVLKYRDDGSADVARIAFDNGSPHYQMKIGNATAERKGIFIDFFIDAHSGYTDLLILEKDGLKEVFENEKRGQYMTYQYYPVGSMDRNRDGIMEIGLLTRPRGTEDMELIEVPWITTWYQWNGKNGLVPVEREYANYFEDYIIQIPWSWGEEFTIRETFYEETNTRKIDFFTMHKDRRLKRHIFSIQAFSVEDWTTKIEDEAYARSVILSQNPEKVVVGILPSRSTEPKKFFIDKERLRELFKSISYEKNGQTSS
ncbi:MAG: hypothetical protein ACOYVK_08955 [Bacillota bacterium]